MDEKTLEERVALLEAWQADVDAAATSFIRGIFGPPDTE